MLSIEGIQAFDGGRHIEFKGVRGSAGQSQQLGLVGTWPSPGSRTVRRSLKLGAHQVPPRGAPTLQGLFRAGKPECTSSDETDEPPLKEAPWSSRGELLCTWFRLVCGTRSETRLGQVSARKRTSACQKHPRFRPCTPFTYLSAKACLTGNI
ncbi:hypothetical protein FA13DRAFT_158282 [Coprinellus micaceus]|uniref:Uncharacterized protein n=1 Tax=Coprinellus micaceus TaxID=71717 RepID=A0A4Y7THP7_COPMI|nr:hypothetical protein FA13DRAFT_158282 [Coprinellus micaceus]